MHYPDMPLNSVSVLRADSSVCEGVEVRIADFGLTDGGNGKILPRGGRLCDGSGRSEARRLHYDIDIKKVSKGR